VAGADCEHNEHHLESVQEHRFETRDGGLNRFDQRTQDAAETAGKATLKVIIQSALGSSALARSVQLK
jgi:flagellar basal body-associated protein FliL